MPETWIVIDTTTVWIVVECLLFCGFIALGILPPENWDARTALEAHASLGSLVMVVVSQGLLTAAVAGVVVIWAEMSFWQVVALPLFGTMAMFTAATACYGGLFAETNVGARGGSIRYRGGLGTAMTRLVPLLAGVVTGYGLAIVTGWVFWVAAGLVAVVSFGVRAILNNEYDFS